MKQKQQTLSNTEIALQEQFKAISKEDFASAFCQVEKSRSDFLVKAIIFGLGALSIKSTIKHGKFKEWLCEALSKAKNETRFVFNEESTIRTAQSYMYLAKQLVKQIEEPNLASTIGQRLGEFYSKTCCFTIERADMYKLLYQPALTLKLVKFVANGFSLRSFLSALTEANTQALAEEEAEKETPAKKEAFQTPVPTKANGQLDFFEIMMKHTDSLKDSIKAGVIDNLDKEQLATFASELEAQLKLVKEIIKNRKD